MAQFPLFKWVCVFHYVIILTECIYFNWFFFASMKKNLNKNNFCLSFLISVQKWVVGCYYLGQRVLISFPSIIFPQVVAGFCSKPWTRFEVLISPSPMTGVALSTLSIHSLQHGFSKCDQSELFIFINIFILNNNPHRTSLITVQCWFEAFKMH